MAKAPSFSRGPLRPAPARGSRDALTRRQEPAYTISGRPGTPSWNPQRLLYPGPGSCLEEPNPGSIARSRGFEQLSTKPRAPMYNPMSAKTSRDPSASLQARIRAAEPGPVTYDTLGALDHDSSRPRQPVYTFSRRGAAKARKVDPTPGPGTFTNDSEAPWLKQSHCPRARVPSGPSCPPMDV